MHQNLVIFQMNYNNINNFRYFQTEKDFTVSDYFGNIFDSESMSIFINIFSNKLQIAHTLCWLMLWIFARLGLAQILDKIWMFWSPFVVPVRGNPNLQNKRKRVHFIVYAIRAVNLHRQQFQNDYLWSACNRCQQVGQGKTAGHIILYVYDFTFIYNVISSFEFSDQLVSDFKQSH